MDIKSKNRHSLGIVIILLAVALASSAMVALYPYLEDRAWISKKQNDTWREQNNLVEEDVALQVMNASYQAWREQLQEEEGRMLTPSQVFLPELEEKLKEAREETYGAQNEIVTDDGSDQSIASEVAYSDLSYDLGYYQSIKEAADSAGQDWKQMAQQYSGRLKYQMKSTDGAVLRSNVTDPQQYFGSLADDEVMFTVNFGQSGAMKVVPSSIKGMIQDPNVLGQALNWYEFYDPFIQRISPSYQESGVAFSGPKNVEFTFKYKPVEFGAYISKNAEPELDSYDFTRDTGYYMAAFCISGLLMILALVLPAFKSLQIGRSVLCRVNFEPVCMLGMLWLMVLGEGTIPGGLMASTANGLLRAELVKVGLDPLAANIGVWSLNLLFWAVMFGMFYWGITCLRAVFSLGLWHYITERTWLGRFCCWVKRWLVRCLNPFNDTDWHSRSSRAIGKAVIANFIILSLISCLWFLGIGALIIYSFVLFFMIQKYWNQTQDKYNRLLEAINKMAEGNLDVEIEEDLGVFNPLKEQLARVRLGFKKAVDQEVKSERTKSELITNVSHDLKTPLTAIITYVNLLKQPGITEEERNSYISVLDQKSMRLKVLIEDLFEVSKASSGAVTLNLGQVDIVSLLKQVRLELADKLESCGVDFRWSLPEEKVILLLDSQKTYRIFENLLVNITKYGMSGTRAYIEARAGEDGYVTIAMRNISAAELTVLPTELTDRFVRGDESRNTEGSGLGLAIARSFTEIQGGTMEIGIEGDLFRVVIRWKREEPEQPAEGEARDNAGEPSQSGKSGQSHKADWENIQDALRRNTERAVQKASQQMSKASKRRSKREMVRAKDEELNREMANATAVENLPEADQAENWDIKQDEAWSVVMDEGESGDDSEDVKS